MDVPVQTVPIPKAYWISSEWGEVIEKLQIHGIEMEALTAASAAALTIYDMAKAVDRGMEIGPTRLVSKSGGKSGNWNLNPSS